jgi:membrane protease YdiL (CAAX protease family)
MVWVYDRTGSLLMAMLMHMSQTATALILVIPDADAPVLVVNLAYAAALWLIVALVVRGDATVDRRGP